MTGVAPALAPTRRLTWILGCVFIAAGVNHFVATDFYMKMMPPYLPAHLLLVQVSGVAEALGGLGVLIPRTRRAAGWGLILLLIAVFPANVQMSLDARAADASLLWQAVTWMRLPFQALFIYWVWEATQPRVRKTR
jgi:uncharacterized membrane protein